MRSREEGVKTLADAPQQLCCGMEINLGTGNAVMPKVRREQRELGPEIDSFLIPCQKSSNGECTAQIMKARASLSFGTTQTTLSQDLQKHAGKRWMSVFGA